MTPEQLDAIEKQNESELGDFLTRAQGRALVAEVRRLTDPSTIRRIIDQWTTDAHEQSRLTQHIVNGLCDDS